MTRPSLKEVLMQRDMLSEQSAEERVQEAKGTISEIIAETDNPFQGMIEAENYLMEEFGLEPDFLEDLIDW